VRAAHALSKAKDLAPEEKAPGGGLKYEAIIPKAQSEPNCFYAADLSVMFENFEVGNLKKLQSWGAFSFPPCRCLPLVPFASSS
jgi:hypothetical protein